MRSNLTFREFLEAEEKQAGHFDAMRDELGINTADFLKGPQVGSFFTLGKNTYNIGAYNIKGFKYARGGDKPADDQDSPTHAIVVMANDAHKGQPDRKRFRKHGDSMMKVPDTDPDSEEHLIPIAQLQDLMTQHMTAAGAGGAAAPPGGMPPMGM